MARNEKTVSDAAGTETNNVLEMLKIDLGINHTLRDLYFNNLIAGCNSELAARGVQLDTSTAEDIMLLSDYAAYSYRKRSEDCPMSRNLTVRIRNRQVRGRVKK